jgi:nuclear protein localization family protein 4
MSGTTILLRVRTQLGIWRIKDVNYDDTFAYLRQRVETEHRTYLIGNFMSDMKEGSITYPNELKIKQANLKNGDLIFIKVDESQVGGAGVHENAQIHTKTISKTGEIVSQTYENISNNQGFRPGMLPLRSMKKHWTLSEFISLDEQFEFKLKAPEKAFCTLAHIDKSLMEEFTNYLKLYDFKRMRSVYLFISWFICLFVCLFVYMFIIVIYMTIEYILSSILILRLYV